MNSPPETTFSFKIPGIPGHQERPRIVRISGFSRMADTKASVNWKALVKLCAQEAMRNACLPAPFPRDVAISLTILAVFPRPKSARGDPSQRSAKLTKPDWDNIGKAISDAMNGVVYEDDCAIYCAGVTKAIGERAEGPFTRVTVFAQAPAEATRPKSRKRSRAAP